ncbi:P450 heme-thiolate domain protein [Mycobacterium xenopi 3993]|nr:P450 heme-thiolate domain protein [Mycobacterium xenopi 3993]
MIGPFFNRGLMMLDFDEHLYHRRIMQEAFTRTRLAGYVEHIDRWQARSWPTGPPTTPGSCSIRR